VHSLALVTRFLLKSLVIFFSLIVFVGCEEDGLSDQNNDISKAPVKLSETGKRLYEVNCAICHGSKGFGDGKAAIALKSSLLPFEEGLKGMSDLEMHQVIMEGRGEMIGWSNHISKTQVSELVIYLRYLQEND